MINGNLLAIVAVVVLGLLALSMFANRRRTGSSPGEVNTLDRLVAAAWGAVPAIAGGVYQSIQYVRREAPDMIPQDEMLILLLVSGAALYLAGHVDQRVSDNTQGVSPK